MSALLPLGATDFVLLVLSIIAVGYFAIMGVRKAGSLLSGSSPQTGSRPGRPPTKSKEELLKPIARKAGIPEMTVDELQDACAGSGGEARVLLGCKGAIFDVSSNEMYGPEGGYNLFVGKDASVALAKMKFNKEFLEPWNLHWSRDLEEKELQILDDWVTRFVEKYPIVAYIKDDLKLKV